MLHLRLVHAFVYILHEVVEMNPRLGCDIRWQGVKEKIHKHRLPTPDIAIHIQALGKVFGDRQFVRLFAASEQGSEERLFRLSVERFNGRMNNLRRIVRL